VAAATCGRPGPACAPDLAAHARNQKGHGASSVVSSTHDSRKRPRVRRFAVNQPGTRGRRSLARERDRHRRYLARRTQQSPPDAAHKHRVFDGTSRDRCTEPNDSFARTASRTTPARAIVEQVETAPRASAQPADSFVSADPSLGQELRRERSRDITGVPNGDINESSTTTRHR
jgi:hypothetical protein